MLLVNTVIIAIFDNCYDQQNFKDPSHFFVQHFVLSFLSTSILIPFSMHFEDEL